MNIVSINMCNYGSTGRIASGIKVVCKEADINYYLSYPCTKPMNVVNDDDLLICSKNQNGLNSRIAKYTGLVACLSIFATFKYLKKLDVIKPDIIHLHNLHNSYINIPMLFSYIKKNNIKVVWTLHDCWAFTGHCPHFMMIKCDKWKTGCGECPQLNIYPELYIDNTHWMWGKKKEWFSAINDLTIVTPSEWLASLVKQSFLSNYPVEVINNGIDLEIFKPRKSDFREKHCISNSENMVLAVSFGWGKRKGLDVLINLAQRLPKNYKLVVVGTDDKVDELLPSNIISIHRTLNQNELAEVYSAADVFVNPTREDTFPTVNIEALACGTPVVSFATGGSPEIFDEFCGLSVDVDNVAAIENALRKVCEKRVFTREKCRERAMIFDLESTYKKYIELYQELLISEESRN